MKSDLSFSDRAKARQVFAAAFYYLFFCAFPNKYCSGFLVYPRLLESRDQNGQLILHVHDGLTLTLEKSSVLAKNLRFVSSSSTEFDTEILNGEKLERKLYHDTIHQSSLIIDQVPGGGVQVRGILTSNFRIAPSGVTSQSGVPQYEHEVSEIVQPSSEEGHGGRTEGSDCDPKDFSSRKVNWNLTGKFVVEICMVTSTSYYGTFESTYDLVEYLGALLNGVQLRYADMKDPQIMFQLNELHVVKDEHLLGRETCTGTDGKQEHGGNSDACGYDTESTLNKTTEYLNECVTTNCDIVYVVIGDDLTYMNNGSLSTDVEVYVGISYIFLCQSHCKPHTSCLVDNNENKIRCTRKVRLRCKDILTLCGEWESGPGIAEIGGICTQDNVALGEDKPRLFSGITTMAHEIGHLLGSDHDGCPNATNCPASYGNLMSNVNEGMRNKSILSNCSMEQIRYLVRRLEDSCLFVNETANIANNFYPGDNMTDEKFCNLTHPEIPVVVGHSNETLQCIIYCCWNFTDDSSGVVEDEYSSSTEATDEFGDDGDYEDICWPYDRLDGMACSENMTCYKGICDRHNWDEIRNKYRTNRTFKDIDPPNTAFYFE